MKIENLKIDCFNVEMILTFSKNIGFQEFLSEEYIMDGIVKFQIKALVHYNINSDRIFDRERLQIWKLIKFVNITHTSSIRITLNSYALKIQDMYIEADSVWHMLPNVALNINSYDVAFKVEITGSMIDKLRNLYDDDELTDFELRGDDGYIRVHKFMLSAISPVFKDIIGNKWKDKSDGFVQMEETSKDTLQGFKQYIYLNTFPPTVSKQLLVIAIHYRIGNMETICIKNLTGNLKDEEVPELLEFALIHKNNNLTLAVLESIQYGYTKVETMNGKVKDVLYVEENKK